MSDPKYGTLEADRAIDEAIEIDIDFWVESAKDLPEDVDNLANELHERIVKQFSN